jgi:hypothetical protein
VVYDPQNGYYFARYAPPNAPGDDTDYVIKALRSQMATVYADATGLYAFEFPNTIWLRVATSRADSIEAAERAYIHEMEQGGPNYLGSGNFRPLNLGKAITWDFHCAPLHEVCQDHLNSIASIGRQGSNWRLVLRNRWDQEIILGSNFDLISTQRLPPPKPETHDRK